jgi:hypothetical protein
MRDEMHRNFLIPFDSDPIRYLTFSEREWRTALLPSNGKKKTLIILSFLEPNGFRSNGNNYSDNAFSTQQSILSSQSETSDIHSLIEIMHSKWLTSNETNRLNYLDRFMILCDKHFHLLRSQYPTSSTSTLDSQFHQSLHSFLTSVLELLSYITSSNLDLSIKIKLLLSTCLAWLIKHAQGNFCKKNYKTICLVFRNILLNGQSNNRQLAVCFFYFFL